jgi:p-aminobenzoyl-glutamate transporter AbgT
MPGNPAAPDAIGEPVTELDEFWLETARTAVRESVASLEEAAKQLIGAVTLVEGIYFAAISFSDLSKVMAVQGTEADLRILLFVTPIVLWLVCLFFAVRVFTPETYKTNLSSPQLAEQLYRELVSYKHRNLKRAYWALLAGFVPLVVAVVYYLRLLDGPG